jgi:hypothetical protein
MIQKYAHTPWSRPADTDITGEVRVSDPRAVGAAIATILVARHPDIDLIALALAIQRFTRLYAGLEPGYAEVETPYHDVQHSLECALAMARLLDGEAAAGGAPDGRRALLGVTCALFHDSGYIRRDGDTARHGAELTPNHVHRSGEYLSRCLPDLGLADHIGVARQIVHFTGYELSIEALDLPDARDRRLGQLLGTADVIGQTADALYLEKCRGPLYDEFALCGMAGEPRPGMPPPIYRSRDDLMRQTPAFQATLRRDRLDHHFDSAWRLLDNHFADANPYMPAIAAHVDRVEKMIARDDFSALTGVPKPIMAAELRARMQSPPN